MHRSSSPLALVGLMAVAGCGQDQQDREGQDGPAPGEDRTATVFVDGTITAYTLDTCERDDGIVTISGRGEGGATLEVVAEVRGDGETVEPATRSSLTARGTEKGDVSVVGPEAWAEQGMTGASPGDMAASRITGDLVQMAGQRIAAIDEEGRPTGEELEIFSLDAHCREAEA